MCDPAGAVLKLFRKATAAERKMAAALMNELRPVNYKAAGTLQRTLDPSERTSRGAFDGLLAALARAGLIVLEEAEYEKDGEVRRFRKVMLTEAGRRLGTVDGTDLLVDDGVAESFGAGGARAGRARKSGPANKPGKLSGSAEAPALSADDEELAGRLRAWRTAEAKRLRVPAYVVMHDRTLEALAFARPANLRELQAVKGIGEAKAEKFGEAILGLCGGR